MKKTIKTQRFFWGVIILRVWQVPKQVEIINPGTYNTGV